jgi:uncharacterized Zn ribbon protein
MNTQNTKAQKAERWQNSADCPECNRELDIDETGERYCASCGLYWENTETRRIAHAQEGREKDE